MSPTTLSGHCLCGAVQYRITGEVAEAFFCHCESCRRSSAGAFVAWGRVDQNCFELLQGKLTQFASSPGATRSRCATCGTEVMYQHEEAVPDLDFPLATLNAPADVTPAYHVRTSEKLPWIQIGDALPQYLEWRPKELKEGHV